MKILVISQYYYPEPFNISSICEALVSAGNDVTVVTGTPNYPKGVCYEGYENGKRADEVINGVKVHRCKSAVRKTGAINRLRNYFSYSRVASKYVKKLPNDFDVVLVHQLSPIMLAKPAIKYKNKFGKKMVLYCLDLWPGSLCVGGVKEKSLLYKYFKRISKKIYCSADEILITSKMFENYLVENFGIEKGKINYLPQFAEDFFLHIKEKEVTEQFNVTFAGNIGLAQDLDTVIESARLLNDENIVFHIVGDGTEYQRIKELSSGLDKVKFYGRKSLDEMPEFYKNTDAMIVTLTGDKAVSMALPVKVQSYLAAGKPILGAINGETQRLLNEVQGGYCVNAGDSQGLAKNILQLKNSKQCAEIGRNNRQFYLKNMSKEKFVENLQLALKRNIV